MVLDCVRHHYRVQAGRRGLEAYLGVQGGSGLLQGIETHAGATHWRQVLRQTAQGRILQLDHPLHRCRCQVGERDRHTVKSQRDHRRMKIGRRQHLTLGRKNQRAV